MKFKSKQRKTLISTSKMEKVVFGKAKTEHLNIYEQRYLMLIKLIKIGKMLKNAKVTHCEIKGNSLLD